MSSLFMLKFIHLMLISLTFVTSFSLKAEAAAIGCGVESECQDGYYCTGAIGESNSGTCIPNSVNVTMCRFLDYVQSDILKGLFIFAAVFAGIYMFVGKLTFGTFGQILIGMAILFGATEVITKITNKEDVCKSRTAQDHLSNIVGVGGETGLIHVNDDKILNLTTAEVDSKYQINSGKQTCDILECMKATCDNYTYTPEVIHPANGTIPILITPAKCESAKGKTAVENLPIGQTTFTPGKCPKKFTVSCTAVTASFSRDYFKCKNTATNTTFGAEASSTWNIKSCNDLAKKQIQQTQ